MIDLDNSTPLTEASFYILLATQKPNHGYGIIQDVSKMTDGRVTLGPGTLYGAINSMLKKDGLVYIVRIQNQEKKRNISLQIWGQKY